MGYGALLVGHGHPVVVDAVRRQLERGTVYLMPCEDNTTVARALAARFGQPMWRFTNSGTESTMPALRAACSFTGRDRVVKTEGAYHGQFDSMLVSLKPPMTEAGPASHPVPVPSSTGIPSAYLSCTTVVAFNDLESLARELHAGDVACVIVEPASAEHRHRHARTPATSRVSASCATRPARCSCSTKSRSASPHTGAVRRRCSVCGPTSCACRSRSAEAYRSGRSAVGPM